MSKILKKTRADLRTLAPEKKILEEKVRLLEEKLVENEAKYGLLERTRMGQGTLQRRGETKREGEGYWKGVEQLLSGLACLLTPFSD